MVEHALSVLEAEFAVQEMKPLLEVWYYADALVGIKNLKWNTMAELAEGEVNSCSWVEQLSEFVFSDSISRKKLWQNKMMLLNKVHVSSAMHLHQ